jgi:hypothetical protein
LSIVIFWHGDAVALPGDFLFLDESGDLGLGAASTPYFVVGVLHLKSRDALKRAIKRARRKSLGRHAHLNELKWSQSSERVKLAVVAEIASESHWVEGISACVIEKGWINPRLAQRSEVTRYNYAVRLALEKGDLLSPMARGRRISLTIDARNRRATETLSEYVALLMDSGELPCSVELKADDSARCPQIQVADFVIGAIYTGYANGDWRYLNTLKKAGIEVNLRSLKSGKKN